MSIGPNNVKGADIRKTVAALIAAGVDVIRVEVERGGKIVVTTSKATTPDEATGKAA
jgi:hypothetical protein